MPARNSFSSGILYTMILFLSDFVFHLRLFYFLIPMKNEMSCNFEKVVDPSETISKINLSLVYFSQRLQRYLRLPYQLPKLSILWLTIFTSFSLCGILSCCNLCCFWFMISDRIGHLEFCPGTLFGKNSQGFKRIVANFLTFC